MCFISQRKISVTSALKINVNYVGIGVSPAPELFQARMHDALAGLKSVACIGNDILIAGSGNTEDEAIADHNRK